MAIQHSSDYYTIQPKDKLTRKEKRGIYKRLKTNGWNMLKFKTRKESEKHRNKMPKHLSGNTVTVKMFDLYL